MSKKSRVEPPLSPTLDTTESPRKRKRISTVYDAVAGRVSTNGFLPSKLDAAATQHRTIPSLQPSAPEAILTRRRHAPERYEEADPYFPPDPPDNTPLPPKDLLSAIHAYTSDFYGWMLRDREGRDVGGATWKSLDETALIALGVLMEEWGREVGKEAADVLVEGVGMHEVERGVVEIGPGKVKSGETRRKDGRGRWKGKPQM
ncbi:MAG: hypothetical protein M1824_003869 [Vezdaea acicularis]|nr:MAG: hypothetical protein M1824_003869 [Vezdaea acicularis]